IRSVNLNSYRTDYRTTSTCFLQIFSPSNTSINHVNGRICFKPPRSPPRSSLRVKKSIWWRIMKFLPEKNHDESVEINLTPLIDVIFLLLIFFMVSTTFIDTTGIQVDLPKTNKTPEKSEQQELLTIAIDKEGNIF